MVYEARHSPMINHALAGACLPLSILGFAAAGVIPTNSGSNPPVGWAIVAACAIAALVFLRRAFDRGVQARIDERGIWSRRLGAEPVPGPRSKPCMCCAPEIQRIARFRRRGGPDFGINTTFYDRGIADLLAAVRHHRPDLAD